MARGDDHFLCKIGTKSSTLAPRQESQNSSFSSTARQPMVDNMIRRSRKKGNGRGASESSSKTREDAMKRRPESINGHDSDEDHAKAVEERIRRLGYGHTVEK